MNNVTKQLILNAQGSGKENSLGKKKGAHRFLGDTGQCDYELLLFHNNLF